MIRDRAEKSRCAPSANRAPIRRATGALSLLAMASLSGPMVGCLDYDSWLLDPSIVGRWEHTPTVVPILERIDVIERDTGEFVDVTPVEPEDLIPEPTDYRVAPGDLVEIEILDFLQPGTISPYSRIISERGLIDLPQIGRIDVEGMTREDIEQAITQAIIDAQIVDDPLVTVQVPGRRQATFSIFGAVTGVGRYAIPAPDYRLLQALTDAGGVNPAIPKILIIRQVTLTDESDPPLDQTLPAQPGTQPGTQPNQPDQEGQDLLDLIDELTDPDDPGPGQTADPPPPSPAIFQSEFDHQRRMARDRFALAQDTQSDTQSQDSQPAQPDQAGGTPSSQTEPPPIDLPDPIDDPAQPQPGEAVVEPVPMPSTGRWVFLNGQWVQVLSPAAGPDGGLGEGADPLASADSGPLVTQRVIEVPTKPLLQGVAKYNVVIRPGDVISVPGPEQGLVYVGGPGINRPGVYNLPLTGKLTIQRLVYSAGGLSPIAIPQRVDLTRIVGENRQATIRINLKAIFSGTHPDIVLKPDDLINVGTNFWATPLAVVRNGFRMSYGFGFLLDRNFGNDVFGAPPTNQFGQ